MSLFEKFVTEGNEKADDLAKRGALLDKGFMAEARTQTMQQNRGEVYAALQYAASFHCSVEEWKDCEAQAKAERKVDLCGSDKASDRMVCGSTQGEVLK